MLSRTNKNVVGSAGLAAGLVSQGLPPLLRFFDAIQWADWIERAMRLIESDQIRFSWDGLWLIIIILSAIWLVAINFDLIVGWKRARVEARRMTWNFPVREAVRYIAFESVLGYGKDDDQAISEAIEAFSAAAKDGRIRVRGRAPPLEERWVDVSRKDWSIAHLDPDSIRQLNRSDGGRLLVAHGCRGAEQLLYQDLVTDESKVRAAWPSKNLPRGLNRI